jgi:hypothetical protein
MLQKDDESDNDSKEKATYYFSVFSIDKDLVQKSINIQKNDED